MVLTLVALFLGWAGYAATFDLDGDFAPTANPDKVVKRVGKRITGVAKKTEKGAKKAKREIIPKKNGKAGKLYKKQMGQVTTK